MLFQQLSFVRMRTLAALDATREDMADVQPEGFQNTIRWNLGHIYTAQENLIHRFIGEEPTLPAHYVELFNANTNPSMWEASPPSLQELRENLAEQTERLKQTFQGRLYEEGDKPFQLGENVTFTTLAEIVNFTIWHEGLHQGTITALKRAQGEEQLFATTTKK
ncbi:DinB family protein [Pontibacillus yanchengensis]|uniref:DinB-like domain-containing protein n=1 Tax=Pontibacillus yanchengensis Y32 TaxID=1385514 RepID=A0A0A2TDZ7_9BACI|nr:DinB family protein [Pontibacillus yanchengensis]KGP74067.1 hypothetical protein N782_17155 [Pontibacillus yanchengensis Y32]